MLFGYDGDFLSAMRADELGVGEFGFCRHGIVLEVEWCFGDECFDCGVECVCDFLEGFHGDVSVEVVLDCSFGDSEDVGEFGLVEFSDLEDESYVFGDVHDLCSAKFLQMYGDNFTSARVNFGQWVLTVRDFVYIFAVMDGNSSINGLPTRYVALGAEFVRYGVVLVCRRRPRVESVSAACKGCWFSRGRKVINGETVMLNCNDIQCSRWDRMDGADVWFVEKVPDKVSIDD